MGPRAAKKVFHQYGGVLRTKEAVGHGIHPRTLYELRDSGAIVPISRGVFRLASLPALTKPDIVTVALRAPRGVLCLISALDYHDLTSEVPHQVHIALPRGRKTPKLDHPPIQAYRFTGPALTEGIQVNEVDGVTVRIYGPEKTVADCFRFRNKIGTDVAIAALRRCLEQTEASPADILHYARICRVENVMLPYLEALQ